MINLIASFERIIQGKKCNFLLDADTPVAIAKEMAFEFLKHVGRIEDEGAEKAKQEQQQEEEGIKNEEVL